MKEVKKASVGKKLPDYASFLAEHHLEEVAKKVLSLSREWDLPILKHLKMSDEELLKLTIPGYKDLLMAFAEERTDEMIAKAVEAWKANQLGIIEKDQIVAEDIGLVGQVRKRLFLHFLPKYTTDPELIIEIVKEIDDYVLKSTTESIRTYANLLQSRIETHLEKFKQSDRLFRQAQAVTHIGNYVWDLPAQSLHWSDELYRIYELDPKIGPVGNDVIRLFNHPDDNAIVDKSIGDSLKTGEPFNFFYRIIMSDGREKVLHARGEIEYDADRNPIIIFGTAQDVTELKKTEASLKANQTFIQKIADAAPSIITSYNVKNGAYLFISQGLRIVLGYDTDTALKEGVSFFMNIMHPEDLAPIIEQNTKAIQKANESFLKGGEESIEEFQYRMRHVNGEYRWFHTYGTVFSRNAAGEVENVLNISLDITEKIKAEQILVQKTLELEHSNKSLEEFAFIASHDLKEPLRKISTLTDRLVVIEDKNLSADGRVYLQKVVSSSIRMQQMIDDLLSLAQVTSDRSYQKVSLQALLTEVLQTFDQKIEESKAKIICKDLPDAVVVPSQFRQLFQNLVSNSLKFRRTEVAPVLEIRHQFLTTHETSHQDVQPASRYVQLTFSDNGIGFDNKFLPKIFSIFQRLHPRHKYEGTGIGLSICRKIVENHGGVIFADGVVDKGATFTVIVPDRV